MKNVEFPDPTIERLCCYRRILSALLAAGHARVYSHELAAAQRVTPAQVRRDVMLIGYSGSPVKGYDIAGLLDRIGEILDPPGGVGVVLVGVGYLGRALLAYFAGRKSPIPVVAAFDVAPETSGQLIHGCHCYHIDELSSFLSRRSILVGIVAVPAEAAQKTARELIDGGVRALLNFAPVQLDVPQNVYVENVDIAVSLEKTAFFAQSMSLEKED
ncbi:MAG: redox-sensing transcriptional repressor Rex [Planctomycetes bacterium]|nr:redox-sensing transcriptional repressor Rex [Planctomycetota bacterium]